MKVTPGYIHAVISIYATCDQITESLGRQLIEDGLAYFDANDRLRSTYKCKKYIEMLCATPLPIQEWIDPRVNSEVGK
jgi:hypothetical protein